MNKGDTSKNIDEKVYIKILIPAYNDYLLKDMKHWMKKAYAHARRQVNWKKAKKIKEVMPTRLPKRSGGQATSPQRGEEKGEGIHLEFVLKPETTEDRSSLKNFLKAFYLVQ